MTGYYLEVALQSLRRNPWLTALAVLAIGVGIGTSMLVYSVLHAMSRDPAPERAWRLREPRIESFGPSIRALPGWAEAGYQEPLPYLLRWPDMMALRALNQQAGQTAMVHFAMTVAGPARGRDAARPGNAKHMIYSLPS